MYWKPQEGPQLAACTCPCDVIFFGGTRGGGKSDTILGRQIRGAEQYGERWNGLIIRKKFKDFKELRRRIDELINAGLPAVRVGGEQQTNTVKFKNGASFILTAIGHIEITDDFIGHQYTEIDIDEAPNFHFIGPMIDKLKGSMRSVHGIPCQMVLTGNPGGPGASQVKLMFMEDAQGNKKVPGQIYLNDEGETTVFIKSTLDDNKILCEGDPKYVNRLRSIKDPMLRRAWLEGDWNVFIGQAFDFYENVHVVKDPIWPIPDFAPLYCTFDWGFGKPFSFGWWWVDNDNRIYRFNEWYGWNGEVPDVGMRITDSVMAQGVIDREIRMGLRDADTKELHKHRQITYLCDPTSFNKKPDYRGGGQGRSTYEEFKDFGIDFRPGDANRELKIRQFRERLTIPLDGSDPMMMVYPVCKHFIRTIPSLCVDDYNPEDVDTAQEDHPYDDSCHICMARPMSHDPDIAKADIERKQREKQTSELDNNSKAAWEEHAFIVEGLEEDLAMRKEMVEDFLGNLIDW